MVKKKYPERVNGPYTKLKKVKYKGFLKQFSQITKPNAQGNTYSKLLREKRKGSIKENYTDRHMGVC